MVVPIAFNVPLPTSGGLQLWTDHRWRDGYRVQRNVVSRNWRLINPKNIRMAWGEKRQCLEKLDALVPQAPDTWRRDYVILLHGLMRTPGSMKPLERTLRAVGFEDVIRFSYASSRGSLGEHAAALRELLENLPGEATFSFVGHSMGNIVVRHLIGDLLADNDPDTANSVLRRCRSMVMHGPPNHGAGIARRLAPTQVYGLVTGKGGRQLGAEWDSCADRLAIPPFPFHIIAGDLRPRVPNPLVDRENDLIVSLDEARLEGAEHFEIMNISHTFMMQNRAAMELTARWLKEDLNRE